MSFVACTLFFIGNYTSTYLKYTNGCIASREFRLEKSGQEFPQGAADTFIAGLGMPAANLDNAPLNDPNNPQLFLASLPATTADSPPGESLELNPNQSTYDMFQRIRIKDGSSRMQL